MKKNPNTPSPKNKKEETDKVLSKSSYVKKIVAHWEVFLVSFFTGVLLMTISIVALKTWKQYHRLQYMRTMRDALVQKKQYWNKLVATYPDYRDAHFQLAVTTYQLGEMSLARKSLESVLRLDPNYKPAEELLSNLKK